MIILEGVDGGGKSYIAEKLALITGRPVVHPGGPPVNAEEFKGRLARFEGLPGNTIVDRHPAISELVYGWTLRKKFAVDESFLWQTIADLVHRDALFVYCKPNLELINTHVVNAKAWKSQEHADAAKANAVRIFTEYCNVMRVVKSRGGKILEHDRFSNNADVTISFALQLEFR